MNPGVLAVIDALHRLREAFRTLGLEPPAGITLRNSREVERFEMTMQSLVSMHMAPGSNPSGKTTILGMTVETL